MVMSTQELERINRPLDDEYDGNRLFSVARGGRAVRPVPVHIVGIQRGRVRAAAAAGMPTVRAAHTSILGRIVAHESR